MPANVNFSTLVALSLFLSGSDSISDVWQQEGEGNCNDDDDTCSCDEADDAADNTGVR